MGNICRSPTAEGVFRHYVSEAGLDTSVIIDSAGTHAYHVGEPPDSRAMAAAERRGMSLQGIRARRVAEEDFERFDLILGMDTGNVAAALEMRPDGARAGVHRFLDYAAGRPADVPDPYYGGAEEFQAMFDMLDEAAAALVRRLQAASGEASSTT